VSPVPIRLDGSAVDNQNRVFYSTTIVASPATNAETIICQIPAISTDPPVTKVVELEGVASFTVGTSGTAVRLRIRQTNVSGAVVAGSDTGALTGGVSAGNRLSLSTTGWDPTPGVAVYVLTLQVTGGAATSTVSATSLGATVT